MLTLYDYEVSYYLTLNSLRKKIWSHTQLTRTSKRSVFIYFYFYFYLHFYFIIIKNEEFKIYCLRLK